MPGTSVTNWLTFTDGGPLGSGSLLVNAGANGGAFGSVTSNESGIGTENGNDSATIVFNPTSTFLVDFGFSVGNLYDAHGDAELLIDNVLTYGLLCVTGISTRC